MVERARQAIVEMICEMAQDDNASLPTEVAVSIIGLTEDYTALIGEA